MKDGEHIDKHGNRAWWQSGHLHRDNGPAFEGVGPEFRKEWWFNGLRHREDGPAIEDANGNRQWWVNGKVHRLDGPAIEKPNGDKEWFATGYRHREDGPAIDHADGTKEWWIHGMDCQESTLLLGKKIAAEIAQLDPQEHEPIIALLSNSLQRMKRLNRSPVSSGVGDILASSPARFGSTFLAPLPPVNPFSGDYKPVEK